MVASGDGRKKAKRGWLGLVLAFLFGLGIATLHISANPLIESVEQGATLDWRFRLRGPQAPPNDIAIVVIDDQSLGRYGQWPFKRAKLAEAVDRLTTAGAKTIGIDILMSEHEGELTGSTNRLTPGEAQLIASLKRHGRVVLAMAMLFNNGSPTGGAGQDASDISLRVVAKPAIGAVKPLTADGLLQPLPEFQQVATVGQVNQQADGDGVTRAQYPVIAFEDWFVPSFPVMVAAAQQDLPIDAIALSLDGKLSIGQESIPLDYDLGLALNHLGPAGTFMTYSFLDLMENRIPDALLRNRVVLLGGSATSLGDTFQTPFDPTLPGVEALATGVANLLHGDSLIRTNEQRAVEAVVIVALTLLAWWLGLRSSGPRWGLAFNALLLTGWLAFAQIMFVMEHRWVAVAGPSMAIVMGAALGAIARMVLERRLRSEVERQRGNLAQYVPPTMVDTLADRATPAFDEREQMAAVLFVDLQGFTHASESRSPADTAHFLKEFHGQLEDVVTAHQGIVAQFLGDGALALWGLPQPRAEDAALALACARDMLLRLARWQPNNPARVGLHYGPVAMAQLGGRHQAQLAAAGDTVNVASRLEAAAKATGTILVISDDMVSAVRALGRDDLIKGLISRRDQPVRGRDKPISYWSAASCAELA
nr:adenylate/guanylate cyclase domain-containing protein [uncultured Dongia sp.]